MLLVLDADFLAPISGLLDHDSGFLFEAELLATRSSSCPVHGAEARLGLHQELRSPIPKRKLPLIRHTTGSSCATNVELTHNDHFEILVMLV